MVNRYSILLLLLQMITNMWICNKSNMTGVTSGTRISHPKACRFSSIDSLSLTVWNLVTFVTLSHHLTEQSSFYSGWWLCSLSLYKVSTYNKVFTYLSMYYIFTVCMIVAGFTFLYSVSLFKNHYFNIRMVRDISIPEIFN